MNDHVRIFKSWTESGNDPHATWVIERQDAKCLFEQLATAREERDLFYDRLQESREQLEAALDSTMHQENYDAACLRADEAEEERDRLKEQLQSAQSIDRNEWREGMVSVYDYDGNLVGSLGQERWERLLAEDAQADAEIRNAWNPARVPLCKCGEPQNAPTETVVQGAVKRWGWKCETCRWWNWLDAPSPAMSQESQ